jgi:hypothetical protein
MNARADMAAVTTNSRLNVTALANAAAIVGGVTYLVCAAITALAPGLYFTVVQSWAHGLGLATLQAGAPSMTPGDLAIGFVTFTVFVWLVSAALAALYNRLSR